MPNRHDRYGRIWNAGYVDLERMTLQDWFLLVIAAVVGTPIVIMILIVLSVIVAILE